MTEYERVYTVTNWFDGPREGIADVNGVPHVFKSLLLEEGKPIWEDLFALKPVDSDTLALALEDWEIWKRWEAAFHAKQTSLETHPALPEDRDRHNAVNRALGERLSIGPGPATRARADFRPASGEDNSWASFRVKWTLLEQDA